MKKFIFWGALGIIGGTIIGELFPSVFSRDLFDTVGAEISQPFSEYRNQLALKYGFYGLIIVGLGKMVVDAVQERLREKDEK